LESVEVFSGGAARDIHVPGSRCRLHSERNRLLGLNSVRVLALGFFGKS
jgi:hypothetical protein